MIEIPLHIPTIDELNAAVVMSLPRDAGYSETVEPKISRATPSEPVETHRLSTDAMAFLRQVALSAHVGLTLDQHFAALGIRSGSVKERILDELRGTGMIRLEKRGKSKQVHLFPAAWEALGMSPPKGMGTGGELHKALVSKLAAEFKSRGYDVRIEFPVGSERKRVDLVAFGAARLGIEVGLSYPDQEIRNIRADLASGALDIVILCSPDAKLLKNVRAAVAEDSWLARRSSQIQFFLIERMVP